MKFPTIVYKTPGSHDAEGGTYDYKGVKDEDELAEYIRRGWYLSLPEALAGKHDLAHLDEMAEEPKSPAPRIPHVADPVIDQFDQILAPGSGQATGQADPYGSGAPMDKSGGSPDDRRGLEQPSAHTHDLSDDTNLVGGTAGTPVVDLDTDRPQSTQGQEGEGSPLDTAGGATDPNMQEASTQQGRTRAELEARANELGIDYDARNSNKTLAKLIAEREQQGV